MPEERAMEPTYRKISVRIWTPLLDRFNQRIDSACLRRDAYLSKVLEDEINDVETQINLENSEAAQSFIRAHLDTVPRKLVTLTLPEEQVQRLDTICERKRIVRDSFFNRLFYLLTAEHRHITRLFFDGDDEWVQDLLERTDFSAMAAGRLLDPIPGLQNPFDTIYQGLYIARDRLAKEPEADADLWFADHRVYTLTIRDPRFGKGDLYGLSLYLPDTLVPGTSDYEATVALLQDFLERTEEHPK